MQLVQEVLSVNQGWGAPAMGSSLVSVLVVEDFIPFRSLICSTLASRVNLQVICEVGDGLEAVEKTKELRPDLILLDIRRNVGRSGNLQILELQNNLRHSGIR